MHKNACALSGQILHSAGTSASGTKFFPISAWPFSVLLRRKSITWLARLNFSSLSYEKIPALIMAHYFAPQALAFSPSQEVLSIHCVPFSPRRGGLLLRGRAIRGIGIAQIGGFNVWQRWSAGGG
jgi:hypothetical protein